jgi:glycosyltransferase involved in cell wall biosynthesis
MPSAPVASIVIPTRDRADYVEVSLASIMAQAKELGAEVIVAIDGPDPGTAEVAERYGARWLSLPEQRGANAARNAGVAASDAPIVIFIDDDIDAPAGWLEGILRGVQANPDVEVFGGPIRARLDGGPRSCGLHPAPITQLDLGPFECDADLVWSANMAVRRTALERVGPFNETMRGHGDEEEWETRYLGGGGRIRYLPAAGLDHRRSPADSRVLSLAKAVYARGRQERRAATHLQLTTPLHAELNGLARSTAHTIRRRCPYGIVIAAHYLGRLRERLAESRRATA